MKYIGLFVVVAIVVALCAQDVTGDGGCTPQRDPCQGRLCNGNTVVGCKNCCKNKKNYDNGFCNGGVCRCSCKSKIPNMCSNGRDAGCNSYCATLTGYDFGGGTCDGNVCHCYVKESKAKTLGGTGVGALKCSNV